jgi:3-deoxy-D-manno-octulosonic acid kinase
VLDFDRGRVRARGAWEQAVLARLKRSLAKVSAGLPAGRFDESAWAALLAGCRDAG